MSIAIDRIDHFVLTVSSIEASCTFYRRVLGAEIQTFGKGRTALRFGRQKINLHPAGAEPSLRAATPSVGGGDFCLIATGPMADIVRHLKAEGVAIEVGPSERSGALGPIVSVYFRDPDRNLVEVAVYETGPGAAPG